jgi:hypothetical protein
MTQYDFTDMLLKYAFRHKRSGLLLSQFDDSGMDAKVLYQAYYYNLNQLWAVDGLHWYKVK